MRHLMISLILIMTINFTYSQTNNFNDCTFYYDSIANRKIYTFVDKMPEYDNKTGFFVNLVSNIELDSIPEMIDIKGAVSFIVEIDGKTSNIKIIDTVNEKFDKSIIEFVRNASKWECGYCNGIAVPVEMKIPYRFEYK